MQRVLVSACLLGNPVRYNGDHKQSDSAILQRWLAEGRVVSVYIPGRRRTGSNPLNTSMDSAVYLSADILLRTCCELNEFKKFQKRGNVAWKIIKGVRAARLDNLRTSPVFFNCLLRIQYLVAQLSQQQQVFPVPERLAFQLLQLLHVIAC